MKNILIIFSLFAFNGLFGQKPIDLQIPANGSTNISLSVKYPDVRIETWDQNHIAITGTAMINHGQNDDSFELVTQRNGNSIDIFSRINNYDQLPRKIQMWKDGQTYFFDTDDIKDDKVQEFRKQEGIKGYSHGVIVEINLVIKVPRKLKVEVEATYGMVEAVNISQDIRINAKYGGLDLTVDGSGINEMTARTRYGEIYSNLSVDFKSDDVNWDEPNKWTTVYTKGGKGYTFDLESQYGNIYLRKP